jgi:hypothetical protein
VIAVTEDSPVLRTSKTTVGVHEILKHLHQLREVRHETVIVDIDDIIELFPYDVLE